MGFICNVAAAAVLIAFLTSPVRAEELHLLGGMTGNSATSISSYGWQGEFQENLNDYAAGSISYLNEGHLLNHHRDGEGVQLWGRLPLSGKRLILSAGIGPYFYFDTTAASNGSSLDNHGWGTLSSVALTWYHQSGLLLQLRSNWVHTGENIDTVSALAGIGYSFDAHPSPAKGDCDETPRNNELTAFLGRTVINTLSSEKSAATSIEYRRSFSRHLDWTAAWLYEGDTRVSRRNGITTELWLMEHLMDDRLSIGIGLGPYIVLDRHAQTQGGGSGSSVSEVATMTAAYRLTSDWALRASWNRVITNYNHDSDVLLGGVGYRF